MTKWMIASDIHGAADYCAQMIDAYNREQPARLILLGDLLYHGPRNDLPPGYAPKRVFDMLNKLSPAPLCVRGNCEAEVDQMVLNFPVMADSMLMPVGDRLAFVTHGHLFSPDAPPPLGQGDVLITGHTHIPAWEDRGAFYYLNPGSVSLPKQGTQHGYIVLEGSHFWWKALDGQVYHELTL